MSTGGGVGLIIISSIVRLYETERVKTENNNKNVMVMDFFILMLYIFI